MHYKIAKVLTDIECDLMYRFPLYMNGSHPIIKWLHENGIRTKVVNDTKKFIRLLKRYRNVNFMTIYNEWYDLFVEILYMYDIGNNGSYYLWEYGAVAAYDIVNKNIKDGEVMNSDELYAELLVLLENYHDDWSIDKLFEVNYIFNKLNDCIIYESHRVKQV